MLFGKELSVIFFLHLLHCNCSTCSEEDLSFYVKMCSLTIERSHVQFFHIISLNKHFPIENFINLLHKHSIPTQLVTHHSQLNDNIKRHSIKNILVIVNSLHEIYDLLLFSVPVFNASTHSNKTLDKNSTVEINSTASAFQKKKHTETLPMHCFRLKSNSTKLFGNRNEKCDVDLVIDKKDLEIVAKPKPFSINPFRGFYNNNIWNAHSFYLFILYDEVFCNFSHENVIKSPLLRRNISGLSSLESDKNVTEKKSRDKSRKLKSVDSTSKNAEGHEDLVFIFRLIWRFLRNHQTVICLGTLCYRHEPFEEKLHSYTGKNGTYFDFSWLTMNRKPFRIVLKYQPPYIEYSFALKKWRGCNYEFLKCLVAKMDFTPSIFHPTDGKIQEGAYRNGSYASALGDLIEDRADINFNYGLMSDITARDFDYTAVSNSIYLCFTLQQRGLVPQSLVISRCFTAFVWFCLLTLYVFYFLIFELYRYSLLEPQPFRHRHSEQDRQKFRSVSTVLAVYQFCLCLGQKNLLLGNLRAGKILFVTVTLSAMIFSTVFQSRMVMLLSKRGYYEDIDSIKDLDESGIYISTRNVNFFKFMFSDDPRFASMMKRFLESPLSAPRSKVIRHTLNLLNNSFLVFEIDKHPDLHDKELHELLIKTDSHFDNDAALAWLSTAERLDKNQIFNYDILNKSYHIHIIQECALSFYQSFTIPRYSAYQHRINSILIRSVEAGLFTKWERDSIESDNRFERVRDLRPDEPFRSFSMTDLQIAFIVLTFGLFFSFSSFIMEYFYYFWEEWCKSLAFLKPSK